MEIDSSLIPYAALEHIGTSIFVFSPTDEVQPYLSPCVSEWYFMFLHIYMFDGSYKLILLDSSHPSKNFPNTIWSEGSFSFLLF